MNKVEKRIQQALETIPKEFHEEFLEMVNYCPQTVKSVAKNEEILLDDILNR